MGGVVRKAPVTGWNAEYAKLYERGSVFELPAIERMPALMCKYVRDYADGDLVFVSYSHTNDNFREELEDQLESQGFEKSKIWSSRAKLKPGVFWEPELICARAAAGVAVILTSAKYFTSEFVKKSEYPQLKRACDRDDLEIGSLKVSDAKPPPGLESIQWLNRVPLQKMSPATRATTLADAAERLAEMKVKIMERRGLLRTRKR
jgi:hypothetical protein